MDYFDEINNGKRFFVTNIRDCPGNVLEVVITIPEVGVERDVVVAEGKTIRAQPVEFKDSSPRYRIAFSHYAAYAVINESFDNGDPDIGVEGKFFRICRHSVFLDYVTKDTFASADYPGPLTHYQLLGQDHIINVASDSEPIVERVSD